MINMKRITKHLVILSVSIFVLGSCKKESEDENETKPSNPTTALVSFQTDVLPIFNTHCNGSYCHGGGADGKSFISHSNVVSVPTATLLGAINHTAGFSPMPKSQPKLMQTDIDTITIWINEGRLNN